MIGPATNRAGRLPSTDQALASNEASPAQAGENWVEPPRHPVIRRGKSDGVPSSLYDWLGFVFPHTEEVPPERDAAEVERKNNPAGGRGLDLALGRSSRRRCPRGRPLRSISSVAGRMAGWVCFWIPAEAPG